MAQSREGGGIRSRSSEIVDDCYVPGANSFLRQKNADRMFREFPNLWEAIMKLDCSQSFHEKRTLAFSDCVEDGFCARFSKEFLIIDAEMDPQLRAFLDGLKLLLEEHKTKRRHLHHRVLLIAREIDLAFGGRDESVGSRWRTRVQAAGRAPGEFFPIGLLLADEASRFEGAGLCRHRSLLLKYVLDRFQVCPCAVLDGVCVPEGTEDVGSLRQLLGGADHMWNVVRVHEKNFLCDIMNAPETFQTAEDLQKQSDSDGRHWEYLRIGGRAGVISLGDMLGESGEEQSSEDESSTASFSAELRAASLGVQQQQHQQQQQQQQVFSRTSGCWSQVQRVTKLDGAEGLVMLEFTLPSGQLARKRLHPDHTGCLRRSAA